MTARAVAARPARAVPHSWRCSRPPSEDHLVTDQDGRPQIVKRCPGCKFGAVNPTVDGGRDIAWGVGRGIAGGVGRGAIQIGGTALDSSDGKGHEDAEHHSGGRRSARHQHLAWVDPSEFRDHVPGSMINESWRDVQRCRSAPWNSEFRSRDFSVGLPGDDPPPVRVCVGAGIAKEEIRWALLRPRCAPS